MRTWAKASAPAALLAAAVMSIGGTALADTSGNSSIGGGNQVDLPISMPIDISGEAVAVGGESHATSRGGASVANNGISNRTSGNNSVLGGNQINAPISAPVNICGWANSEFGKARGGCKGSAEIRGSGRGGNRTSGDGSLLGGNQLNAPISAPVNFCGNATAIFGHATAGCKGGASVVGGGSGGNVTSGRNSKLGGNQVITPVSAPINLCGSTVAVFGDTFSGCKGGATVHGGGGHGSFGNPWHSAGNDTDGRFAAGSGNQLIAPVSLPVSECGNAVGHTITAGCKGGAAVRHGSGNVTSGKSGTASGNQAIAGLSAPISLCGRGESVYGKAFTGCKGGATVKGTGGNTTSGGSGTASGNQLVAPESVPVDVCGGVEAVLSKAEGHCKGGATVSQHHGSTTSGGSGVAAGNQLVKPISAPVNVCGNAVAVLGDAAAGCLGGSHVGKPVNDGYGHYGHYTRSKTGGVLPALPAVPVLGGLPGAGTATQQMHAGGTPEVPVIGRVPVVEQAHEMFGLPDLPNLPAAPGVPTIPDAATVTSLPGAAGLPSLPDAAAVTSLPGAAGLPSVPGVSGVTTAPVKDPQSGKVPAGDDAGPKGPLAPATSLVDSTPVGGTVKSTAGGLPTGGLGLMSAAQPAGVTGMTNGSLFALVLGGMLAASATLFATTRRFRLGKK
jgi:hypothetical protein